ncbi:MAG: flagellar biosynthesis protein FlgF, partial [Alphaproteobacteria bacterium]|nr:flagellar biosynthesis protein FlgF [Alphaproteobacteria bacterium]
AIDGPGFLQVQTADGGTAYTRAGRLSVDADGQLIVSGRPVLSADGQPITVDPLLASDLTIANDGTLTSREGPVGQIGLVTFANPSALLPRGDGLLNAAGAVPQPAESPRLRVGFLEGSNVQPIAETTQLVEISRAYERAQKLSSALDDLRRRAIERLGRLN